VYDAEVYEMNPEWGISGTQPAADHVAPLLVLAATG
jgi:hypothetical protein